ncbi:hypothetical protein Glove_772g5 [Diversispora epigaea]|uniref:Fido domain-containing protein n=1 Tax=Diversispora epigaea TaxID=1348612 RepID=A0A397FZ36_9GLOM|nr:hypothetical protein Glove_772g5 [Diversispora epigaea]
MESQIVKGNNTISYEMLHSKFDILNKPWWRNSIDERDVKYFILNLEYLQKAISLAVNKNDALFWKGYIDLHYENYTLECISSESDVDLSIDFVQKSLKKSWFHKMKMFLNWSYRKIFTKCLKPERSSFLAKKVQNLHKAITNTFPPVFFPNLPIEHFTPSFAQQLHLQIGNGLINNAGQYRTRFVMAAQDNLVYLTPDLIENRMNELFRQCREKFERTDLQLKEAIKFGACFLSHFLLIHPFMNGNGRVARLLLSYLLSRFTVVPLSLYIGTKTRDVYLQCLREAQWSQGSFKPSVLESFILECIYMTSYNLCVVMDIEIQDSVIES